MDDTNKKARKKTRKRSKKAIVNFNKTTVVEDLRVCEITKKY